MSKQKLKKGDIVTVIAGTYKGKSGEILEMFPKKNKAIVAGINIVKKHEKPSAKNPQGGIIEKEAPIHVSNLMINDPSSGKPSRIGFVFEGDKKIRIAKKSGKPI